MYFRKKNCTTVISCYFHVKLCYCRFPSTHVNQIRQSRFKKVMLEKFDEPFSKLLSVTSIHQELKKCLTQIKVYYLLIKTLLQGEKKIPSFNDDNISLLGNFYFNPELLIPQILCTYRSRKFCKKQTVLLIYYVYRLLCYCYLFFQNKQKRKLIFSSSTNLT